VNNAYLAIALSVLMHVAWNLLARHVDKRCNFLWWGLLVHLLVLGPWAFWRLFHDSNWSSDFTLAMAVSATANTLYFMALRKAYHYAPVALVYPVARSSPLLIVLWSWLLFQQGTGIGGLSGILISVAGLWVLAVSSRHGDARHAIPWAIGAALATSIYSISDKLAVSYLPSFGAQMGFISVGYLASFLGLSVIQWFETRRLVPVSRPRIIHMLLGGLFIGTAYALIVRAMLELPAAIVVAYTNAGIVLATMLSIVVFRETENARMRILAAVIISAGLIVLGISN
jgi:phosphonate utilization associated putative membrane protein